MEDFPSRVEMIDPILCVTDLEASLAYYTEVLGFEPADWNTGDFTSVGIGGCGMYLAEQAQGQTGAWVWIGVENVRPIYDLYVRRGARIRLPPTKFPHALEMQVEDPDGNVLRFGSDPDD